MSQFYPQLAQVVAFLYVIKLQPHGPTDAMGSRPAPGDGVNRDNYYSRSTSAGQHFD